MKNGNLRGWGFCMAWLLLATGVLAAPPPQGGSGGQVATPLVSPEPPEWEDRSFSKQAGEGFEATEVRRIVGDLSKDASVDEVELALFELLPQIYKATNRDLAVVGEALAGLREKPGAVKAFARHYEQLPTEAFEKRLTMIGILGEMKRPDALTHLREVVWAPLPVAKSSPEGLTPRDFEEMIQAKAVHGLAYLATTEAGEAVREVTVSHEAMHVRVSAIDAYMWNHGDSQETAEELYSLLPDEMHPYVERPRFHRGMDREKFTKQLQAWRKKWSSRFPQPAADDSDGGAK